MEFKKREVVLLGVMIAFYPVSALAYLDPGTGSMLIQMIIGGVVAALFTIKMYWYQFKSFIKRKFGNAEEETSADSANSNLKED